MIEWKKQFGFDDARPDVIAYVGRWSGDTIVKINGKTFSCEECGSNVFRKRVGDPLRYCCNGCGAMYRGEEKRDGSS